jgi:hypothetical protein
MDKFEELEKLAQLRDQGVLSDEEFTAEKAKVLGREEVSNSQPQPTTKDVVDRNATVPSVGGQTAQAALDVASGAGRLAFTLIAVIATFLLFFAIGPSLIQNLVN